jgi:hypothetical protein
MSDRLTLTPGPWVSDDWYSVEPGRFGGASVEGTADEMREIARAILGRSDARFKRAAVLVLHGHAEMWSPRNSTGRRVVPLAVADDFARRALAMLGEVTDAD